MTKYKEISISKEGLEDLEESRSLNNLTEARLISFEAMIANKIRNSGGLEEIYRCSFDTLCIKCVNNEISYIDGHHDEDFNTIDGMINKIIRVNSKLGEPHFFLRRVEVIRK